eukprot:GFKZ01007899.1.p1 GENE.GFKZ01007899.1~~GFKZ01007899.1.p1  ORF type:complete len:481 (-),score=51.77 GFKZ01007899.1:229-1671(-)
MFSVMVPPRHIAPSTAIPLPLAPAAPPPPSTPQLNNTMSPPPAPNDVFIVGDQAFNGRGYEVCGVKNQRGNLCGRIGACPFHAKKNNAAKRPRPANGSVDSANPLLTSSAAQRPNGSAPRRLSIPPQKARFKRSWTEDEHRKFLTAMKRFGKGKWKEIAAEVGSRTANQCQSHAQKFFLRQAKSDDQRKKKSIHDITEDDVTTELQRVTAAWSATASQSMSQGMSQSSSQTAKVPVPLPTVSTSPVVSRPFGAAVPLAPHHPGDTSVPLTMDASTSTTANDYALATSMGMAAGLNFAMSGDAEGLLGLSAAPPAPTTSAALSASIGSNALQSPQTSSAAANSLSIVPNSNGLSAVPVVLPMSSLGLQYASMAQPFLNSSVGNPNMAAVMGPAQIPKIRVTVHVNGREGGGKALMLPQTMEEFFHHAEDKLQIEGPLSRVFTRSGAEITLLDEMCPDDTLWLSCGEDFMTPRRIPPGRLQV